MPIYESKLRQISLSPISSLPPEVFTAIFSLACFPGTSSLGGEPDHHLVPLRISHVCRRWREIALNQPLLWSHVGFSDLSPVGVTEILARAKSVPLYLEADFRDYRRDDIRFSTFQKELQARVPRVRRLIIGAEPSQIHSTLERLVSPAPTLEYLTLSSRGRRPRTIGSAHLFPPDTLFDGSAPRLCRLELHNYGINWKSSLLKGLKYLVLDTISYPDLAVWLGALDEMPQLKTLTLHWTSPNAPFQLAVERTITLPSLTSLDILTFMWDCSVILAHLDLPALTSLCVTAICPSHIWQLSAHVQILLPYVVRHAHGPQDTQPLQSVLIHGEDTRVDILAWPEPNIDDVVHDSPTLLAATLPTRIALSFQTQDWLGHGTRLFILEMVMVGLPLDGLVTLAAHNPGFIHHERGPATQQLWLHLLPKCPLLKRVRIAYSVAPGFIVTLRQDNGGCERPLLPSLTELVLADCSLNELSELPLYDALMDRVENRVPMQMLDLRMCMRHPDGCGDDWFRTLSDVVVNVLGPEKTLEEWEQMKSMWKTVVRGTFVNNDYSREDDRSD
ncbi:hypothetical protein EI94DRAFT_466671 [Lactarius quietus]|nr:hypothetical protein EI94DRAFT_466671 [Lactarius quietus]